MLGHQQREEPECHRSRQEPADKTGLQFQAPEQGLEAADGAYGADEKAEGVPAPGGGAAGGPDTGSGETEPAEPTAAADADASMRGSDREDTVGTGGASEPTPGADAAEAPAAPDEADASTDGGIDVWTAAEIGLAAALAVLIVGILALAYAGRKR